MSAQIDDRKIVERLFQKDTKTLVSFYKENVPALHKFIYRQVKDYHLAEEITKTYFLIFWKRFVVSTINQV